MFASGKPEGLRVGDEMHLMTCSGEFNAKLGSDNATAAVGGITRDADLHGDIVRRVLDAVVLSGDSKDSFTDSSKVNESDVPYFWDDIEQRLISVARDTRRRVRTCSSAALHSQDADQFPRAVRDG